MVPIRARGFRLRATTSGSRAEPMVHSTPQHAARAAALSFEPMPPRPEPPARTRTARASAGLRRTSRSLSDESRYAARTSVRNSSLDASAATATATATWSLSSAESGSVASLPFTTGSRPRAVALRSTWPRSPIARADARSLRDTRIWQTSTPTAAASWRYSAMSAGCPTAAGSAVSAASAPSGRPSSGPSYRRRISPSDSTSRSWLAAACRDERTEPTSACSAAAGPAKASSLRPRRAAPEVTRMISWPARWAAAIWLTRPAMTSRASPSRLAMELEPSLITCLVTDNSRVIALGACGRGEPGEEARADDHSRRYHGAVAAALGAKLDLLAQVGRHFHAGAQWRRARAVRTAAALGKRYLAWPVVGHQWRTRARWRCVPAKRTPVGRARWTPVGLVRRTPVGLVRRTPVGQARSGLAGVRSACPSAGAARCRQLLRR